MGRATIARLSPGRRLLAAGVVLGLLAGAALAVGRAADAKPAPQGHDPADVHGKGLTSTEEKAVEEEVEEAPSALEHVMDARAEWELFPSAKGPLHSITLPVISSHRSPLWGDQPLTFSKFMILELLSAVLIAAIYIPIARRLRTGEPPKGAFANCFESILTFIRNDVAKPAIGEHDADRFVPFLWTLFLFILFNNLFGLIPGCGSATASIFVTGALAVCAFFAIHGSAIQKMGFGHYVTSMWPHIDVPFGLGYVLKPLIFCLEWLGVLVRNGVLAVRLFANMFAGHVVLATLLIFIFAAGQLHWGLWGTVSVLSVVGQVALSLLELFIAFLQAYIFTILTAIFMGIAMHPAH